MASKIKKEHEVLFSAKTVMFNGNKIDIKKFSWTQTIKALRLIGEVSNLVIANADFIAELYNGFKGAKTNLEQLVVITNALTLIDDELINALNELISLGSGLDEDSISNGDPDEVFIIAKAIYEVNAYFFKKRFGEFVAVKKSETKQK